MRGDELPHPVNYSLLRIIPPEGAESSHGDNITPPQQALDWISTITGAWTTSGREERSLDDIRALGCNSLEDEREFAAAARVSDLNNALYQTFLQPWIKMASGPQVAAAVLELNPLRLGYSLPSDRNPMMRGVASTANYVRAERTPASTDNPFIAMQQQFSKTMVDTLNLYRDLRDELVERSFHAVYGSPLVQAACGILCQ